MINFGLVFLLSLVHAYLVKHRAEILANSPSTATNGAEDEGQPQSNILQAAYQILHLTKILGFFCFYVTSCTFVV